MGDAANSPRKAGALLALTLLVALPLTGAAGACPAPDQLHAEAIDRSFVQEKSLAGMAKPLRSEGRLTATASEIVWHMTTPFDVKTVITASGISQSVDNGPAQSVGPGSAEMGVSIAKSMAAMMRGQWEELKTLFSVSLPPVQPTGDWAVVLKPLDGRLGNLLGTITVHGCTDVESVAIERPDGDRETIVFGDAKSMAVRQ